MVSRHSDERGAQETAKKAAQFGVRAETIHLDLSQLPEGAQAIEHLIQRLGRVDVLVNNAGAMTKSAFIDMPFTQWRQILPWMSTARFSARRSPPGI